MSTTSATLVLSGPFSFIGPVGHDIWWEQPLPVVPVTNIRNGKIKVKVLRYPPFNYVEYMFLNDDDVQYDKQKAGLCHRVSCGN